jgi:hypothetical protein
MSIPVANDDMKSVTIEVPRKLSHVMTLVRDLIKTWFLQLKFFNKFETMSTETEGTDPC